VFDRAAPARGVAAPVTGVTAPVTDATTPVFEAAAAAVAVPVLSAVSPITDVVQLSLIKNLLQMLSTIFGLDLGATGLPITKRSESVS
jgi:hypothetical protein